MITSKKTVLGVLELGLLGGMGILARSLDLNTKGTGSSLGVSGLVKTKHLHKAVA